MERGASITVSGRDLNEEQLGHGKNSREEEEKRSVIRVGPGDG